VTVRVTIRLRATFLVQPGEEQFDLFDIRVAALCLSCLIPLTAAAQLPPAAATPPALAPSQTTPTTTASVPPAAAPKKPRVPDYPDPRTITVGIYEWATLPGTGPDLKGGKAATGYSSLYDFGKDHPITPNIDFSMPITRTGIIHLEAFLNKGDGSQTALKETTVYGTQYLPGDYLSTQYQFRSAKMYYEDLLWPYKFPVSKFRVRSLWEFQWVGISSTIDAPLKTSATTSTGTAQSNTALGGETILWPTFGLAPEYALTPHVLLRAEASGFAIPHRAVLWDALATVSYRHKSLEVVGGFRALHFKSSPSQAEYMYDTIDGGFVGLRWHL
jgi:hypothetical protein